MTTIRPGALLRLRSSRDQYENATEGCSGAIDSLTGSMVISFAFLASLREKQRRLLQRQP
jgi:hypothetical protein